MFPSSHLFAEYNHLQNMLVLLKNPQAHFNLAGAFDEDLAEVKAAIVQIEDGMREMIDYAIWMEAIG